MIYRSALEGDPTRYVIATSHSGGRLSSVAFAEYDPTDAEGWVALVEIRAKDLPQLIAQLSTIYAETIGDLFKGESR